MQPHSCAVKGASLRRLFVFQPQVQRIIHHMAHRTHHAVHSMQRRPRHAAHSTHCTHCTHCTAHKTRRHAQQQPRHSLAPQNTCWMLMPRFLLLDKLGRHSLFGRTVLTAELYGCRDKDLFSVLDGLVLRASSSSGTLLLERPVPAFPVVPSAPRLVASHWVQGMYRASVCVLVCGT
jgi:hypothetical protein